MKIRGDISGSNAERTKAGDMMKSKLNRSFNKDKRIHEKSNCTRSNTIGLGRQSQKWGTHNGRNWRDKESD